MLIEPSLKQFKSELKCGNVVPVCLNLPGDLETPVSIFLKLAQKKQDAFLLESVELGEQLGRFSLIGMEPEILMEYQDGRSVITKKGTRKSQNLDFLKSVNNLLSQFRLSTSLKLPPLIGSFVGFIGYELVQEFEDIELKLKKGLPVPDSVLMFPTNLVVFDHIKHELKLIYLVVDHKKSSAEKMYRNAKQVLSRMRNELNRPSVIPERFSARANARSTFQEELDVLLRKCRGSRVVDSRLKRAGMTNSPKSNLSKNEFVSIIKRAKEHIRAGDCIQIVLSQRFDLGKISDDFQIYRSLRSLNPSPYMFYLKHKNFSLVGSSPEMLVKKTGRLAETRPIAGTRPRGRNEQEDLQNEAALRASKKEMAEHIMLVDLGRNDLGRVSDPKSVTVEDFARIERYSHVMHLVSVVKAILKKKVSALDLLRASFPAGTVTGAPKIKAMQIIDQLEHERRGPYAGSFGYFGLNGDMDMCITIRTIVVCNKEAYVQAGAGIVNDSTPEREYQETINKAKALMQAVQHSEF